MAVQSALELRPRGVGELFDLAIRLYRKNFLKFIGIIAIAQVPVQLIQLIISFFTFNGVDALTTLSPGSESEIFTNLIDQLGVGMGASFLVGLLSIILVQVVATAALTRAITDSYLGEEIGIERSYEKIGPVWGPLLWTLFLFILINFGFIIWMLVPCAGWLTGLGVLFFSGLVISPLIAPIVVIERRSGGQALRRAWDLTRRRFWWMVGFVTLLFFFNLLVVSGPVAVLNSILSGFLAQNMSSTAAAFIAQIISQSLAGLFLSLLYQPLQCACATLVYFDLRVRQEGFDLAWMAQQASETPLSAIEVASQAPVGSSKSLITWPEVGNFILLSLLGGAIYTIPLMLIGLVATLFGGAV